MSTSVVRLDHAARQELLEKIFTLMAEHYLFPDVAARMVSVMRDRLASGAYDDVVDPFEFEKRIDDELVNVTGDIHMRLRFYPQGVVPRYAESPTPEARAEYQLRTSLHTGGIYKVERLAGNIGYIMLRSFMSPEFGGEEAAAVMNLVWGTSALIIDLRQNTGGASAMGAFLASYLLSPPVTMLTSWEPREGRPIQAWTLDHVPGRRYFEKPVYLLTSKVTFSCAEEFCYSLQALKRAVVVGGRTSGGAHAGYRYDVSAHFGIYIPSIQAINPITGTNWERVGVIPDVEMAPEEALTWAYRDALQKSLEKLGAPPPGPLQELVEEAQKALTDAEGGMPT